MSISAGLTWVQSKAPGLKEWARQRVNNKWAAVAALGCVIHWQMPRIGVAVSSFYANHPVAIIGTALAAGSVLGALAMHRWKRVQHTDSAVQVPDHASMEEVLPERLAKLQTELVSTAHLMDEFSRLRAISDALLAAPKASQNSLNAGAFKGDEYRTFADGVKRIAETADLSDAQNRKSEHLIRGLLYWLHKEGERSKCIGDIRALAEQVSLRLTRLPQGCSQQVLAAIGANRLPVHLVRSEKDNSVRTAPAAAQPAQRRSGRAETKYGGDTTIDGLLDSSDDEGPAIIRAARTQSRARTRSSMGRADRPAAAAGRQQTTRREFEMALQSAIGYSEDQSGTYAIYTDALARLRAFIAKHRSLIDSDIDLQHVVKRYVDLANR